MSVWVVDASPLIFLAKLDRLDLLIKGASQILIPPTVLNEVQAHSDAATLRIENALPFFDVRMPAALTALRSLGLLEVRTVRLRGPRSRRLVRTALSASRNDNP